MCSPLIDALRKKYPDSQIYWLTQPECKNLIEHHPELAEVIVFNKKEFSNLLKQKQFLLFFKRLRAFKRMLRSKQFDLVLDTQGLLKSGLLAWFSNGVRTVGLGSKEMSQLFMDEVYPRDKGDTTRISSEYLYLAEQLGCDVSEFDMRVHYSAECQGTAKTLLTRAEVKSRYVVFCPFTTRPQKHWNNEAWRELAHKLSTDFNVQIVILGGPGDKKAATELIADTDMINLVGETSLTQAAAIIEGAHAVVGVDTGLTHIAHSFKNVVVSVFGSTCPYLNPNNTNGEVIYLNKTCSPCRRNPTCDGRFECMGDIKPDMVISRLEQKWQALEGIEHD